MPESRYDAIVIGAGMSGLAAAIRLAQFDRRVLLVERHSLVGGLNSWYKRGGRRFDTGLHALTNYAPRGAPGAPLTKILRQLRLEWDALQLAPQTRSQIVFPGERLSFSNENELLESEVARAFPASRDGLRGARRAPCAPPEPFDAAASFASTRARLDEFALEPQLREMLLLPLLWYGSALAEDLDWDDFVILFRSILLEGFARPEGGVKTLLDLLLARARACGAELRTNSPVARILVEDGAARGVELEGGETIRAEQIYSSAGWIETCALAGAPVPADERGWVTIFEHMCVTKTPHRARGHDAAITFFSEVERPRWSPPAELVELRDRRDLLQRQLPDARAADRRPAARHAAREPRPLVARCAEDEYEAAKLATAARLEQLCARHVPDPRPETVLRDSFTPRTIRHYTAHAGGAVYGSPLRHRDGRLGHRRAAT